jgi:site-specific recombinase XerD
MEEKQVTINELVARMLQEMKRVGYAEEAIYRNYYPKIRTVARYYTTAKIAYYSVASTEEYVKYQEERFLRDEISATMLKSARYAASRMNEFFITGTLRVKANKHGTVYVISPENENLIDRFIDFRQYKENTCDDVRWVVRKYLFYLEQKGFRSMDEVSIEDVRQFILDTAMDVKASSLHNILLYLKYFHMFLKDEGIPAPDCVDLFSYKVYRDMPIQSYVTDEELNRIINVIDRSTIAGKRDFAIIQLSASTGLRACDIISLRLKDIDWRKGEINITQKKTGRNVVLPLVTDAANALQDYILNGRPEADTDVIFLRIMPPFVPISNAACLGDMFKRYQYKAGLTRQALDGKGFHGLRRRLAKKLLVSGTPSTSIAQILGHDDVNSVRQYLCLNTDNIKECALSFDGIELSRKERK